MVEESKKPKVLVVDDEKIIRDFFSKLLSLQGFDVACAESGAKALELAGKDNFSLYFVDIRMPVMDGLETFRNLRKIHPQANVVMMTGYAVEEILKQAHKEGVYGSIRKPFDIGELKQILEGVTVDKKGQGVRVLVVDDDEMVRNFFTNLMNSKNLNSRTARNRDEALAAVKEQKFDLVFLDLMLGDTNGMELYPEIKKILPQAMVVVITGFPQKIQELKGVMDIAGCLYKPFDIENILKCIDSVKPPHQ